MITVKHKLRDYQISPVAETLIIGTFNPDTPENEADFFYGRGRNYLWRLLPTAFGENDLKGAAKHEKLEFIKRHRIDFIDLIEELSIEADQKTNYYDGYIDRKVTQWRDLVEVMEALPYLIRVCFTRKSFSDIPNMTQQLEAVKQYCAKKGIPFKALVTPARFYREDKQTEWTNFLRDDTGKAY